MNDIYGATLRRSVLSAVYAFGGLHLFIVPNPWLSWYGICGLLLSPFVGLLHGLLMWPVISLQDRGDDAGKLDSHIGFYSLCSISGGVAYAGGTISVMLILHDGRHFDPEFGWLWMLIGGIAGARLGMWVLQEIAH